jgi:hypothetical protein
MIEREGKLHLDARVIEERAHFLQRPSSDPFGFRLGQRQNDFGRLHEVT